jgi:asparagine synthase (glutamine-hydrolysing)
MIFVAGLVRHDGSTIPPEWISALAASAERPDHRLKIVSARQTGVCDAVFVLSEGALREAQSGSLVFCDARLDESSSLAFEFPADCADAIARAYDLEGEAVIERIVGDYSLAIWNSGVNRLILARAELATRPLCYTIHDGVFAFATSLRALLALPFVSRDLNDGAICRALALDGRGAADETSYADVRRLPAAHRLTLEKGETRVTPFAAPALPRTAPARPIDPVETARGLLIEAVECRIRPGETIGVHLSGGLDSSAIACIAARRLKREGRRLLALCSVLPAGHAGPETDERPFMEAVIAQEDNIDPIWIEMPPDSDPFAALPRYFDCLHEPPFSSVTHVEQRLGEIGREQGIDAALSGFGGDFFLSAKVAPPTAVLLERGRLLAAAADLWRLRRSTGQPWRKLVREHALQPLAHRYRSARADVNAGCAAAPLLDRIERSEGRRPLSTAPGMARATTHETMSFILAPGHLERVLPAMRQVFVEQFGQDLRFPLLDPRIVAFVLGVGEEDFNRSGQSRSLMRRAMAGILPELVRQRPDKGAAFDPALAAHCANTRHKLREWSDMADPRCWEFVDKPRFLAALEAVEASGRAGWRSDMFSHLLTGGRIAQFIEWHTKSGDPT